MRSTKKLSGKKQRGGSYTDIPVGGAKQGNNISLLTAVLIGIAIVVSTICALKYFGFIGNSQTSSTIVVQALPSTDSSIPPPPERLFDGVRIPPGSTPIYQRTQGDPGPYQQVGTIVGEGASSGSATRTVLPLFGRPAVTNRSRWNYYTQTDGLNPQQVDVSVAGRDCGDDNGCDEISSNDSVAVPTLGVTYIASVYRYGAPKYIP